MGRLGRTIENPADWISGESCLLVEVQMVWNLWSVRIVRPRRMLHVPFHDTGVYQEGLRSSKMGRREFPVEKDLELNGKGSWGL